MRPNEPARARSSRSCGHRSVHRPSRASLRQALLGEGEQRDATGDEDGARGAEGRDALVEEDGGKAGRDHDARLADRGDGGCARQPEREQRQQVRGRGGRADGDRRRPDRRANTPPRAARRTPAPARPSRRCRETPCSRRARSAQRAARSSPPARAARPPAPPRCRARARAAGSRRRATRRRRAPAPARRAACARPYHRHMHLTEAVLAPLRERYGEPERLEWTGEISEYEHGLATYNPKRTHDVTLFILNGERLALIRKPQFEEGVWRPPGGGIKPGEAFEDGVRREAHEETGLEVELRRYLVDAEARFLYEPRDVPWRTHVFLATTE